METAPSLQGAICNHCTLLSLSGATSSQFRFKSPGGSLQNALVLRRNGKTGTSKERKRERERKGQRKSKSGPVRGELWVLAEQAASANSRDHYCTALTFFVRRRCIGQKIRKHRVVQWCVYDHWHAAHFPKLSQLVLSSRTTSSSSGKEECGTLNFSGIAWSCILGRSSKTSSNSMASA